MCVCVCVCVYVCVCVWEGGDLVVTINIRLVTEDRPSSRKKFLVQEGGDVILEIITCS